MKRILLACTLAALCLANALPACDVPVFRYALERWPAETYTIVASLPEQTGTAGDNGLKLLRNSSIFEGGNANYRLEEKYYPAEQAAGENAARLEVIYYSQSGLTSRIWQGPLSRQAVSRIVGSPLRSEIAEKLIGGATGVWLLLECGDRQRDDQAAELIGNCMREMENRLTLPEAVKTLPPPGAPELKVNFSLLLGN